MHATEMKTKRHYTTPVTQRATVELEGGFCGSIYETKGITIKSHEIGEEYDFNGSDQVGTAGSEDAFSISWGTTE